MTNIEARKRARVDIIKTLKSAGLVDGISLAAEKLQTTTATCFYHGVVRNEKAKAKDNYVTWYIPASGIAKRADDGAFLREVTIAIDVFSKRSFDSEQNFKMLEKLETEFTKDGYEVEFGEELYESDSGLFHYSITLYKLY
jgi:hypothetical protein